MGYRSIVAAAIGSTPEKVKNFSQKIQFSKLPDKAEIFDHFKVITLNKNFVIFAAYFDWVKWYEDEQESWKMLTDLAENAGLSYVFYRVGEDENDIEILSNSHKPDFDISLFQLFSINSHIVGEYSELSALNMNVS